jgi:hypothetical protein
MLRKNILVAQNLLIFDFELHKTCLVRRARKTIQSMECCRGIESYSLATRNQDCVISLEPQKVTPPAGVVLYGKSHIEKNEIRGGS